MCLKLCLDYNRYWTVFGESILRNDSIVENRENRIMHKSGVKTVGIKVGYISKQDQGVCCSEYSK